MKSERRDGGWVSTLVALVVLVVVGFLCGALAGFLWEEPGLVVAYLKGDTKPVEWSETGAVSAEPPSFAAGEPAPADPARPAHAELLGAAPITPDKPTVEPAAAVKPAAAEPAAPKPAPEKAAAVKPAPAKPPAATPAPKPAKVAAVAPAGRFSVQVGAFGDNATAEKLVARLRAKGYPCYVKSDVESGGKRYRVRVGPVDARERAEELAAKLAKGEKLPTWVLDESGA
jgi:DedD protein